MKLIEFKVSISSEDFEHADDDEVLEACEMLQDVGESYIHNMISALEDVQLPDGRKFAVHED